MHHSWYKGCNTSALHFRYPAGNEPHLEDGRVTVRVDSNDGFGFLHARHVLDGPRDANCDVQLWRNHHASLPNLQAAGSVGIRGALLHGRRNVVEPDTSRRVTLLRVHPTGSKQIEALYVNLVPKLAD